MCGYKTVLPFFLHDKKVTKTTGYSVDGSVIEKRQKKKLLNPLETDFCPWYPGQGKPHWQPGEKKID